MKTQVKSRALAGLLVALAGLPALPAASAADQQPSGEPNLYVNGFEPPVCVPRFPNGILGEYDSTFGNVWPGYNDKLRAYVPNNSYLSLRFTAAASPNQFGSVITTGFPGDGDGQGLMSISTTPGCFDPAFLGPKCLSPVAMYPQVSWTHGQSMFACRLNPGQDYYLNLTYGNGLPTAGEPGCTTPGPDGCGSDFGNIQQ